jgi:hypothetical protein
MNGQRRRKDISSLHFSDDRLMQAMSGNLNYIGKAPEERFAPHKAK